MFRDETLTIVKKTVTAIIELLYDSYRGKEFREYTQMISKRKHISYIFLKNPTV